MAINFPNSPNTNDTFTANGNIYSYDGEKWILATGGDIYLTNPVESNFLASINGAYNIGQNGTRFDVIYANVFNGVATEAKYADLAEIYSSDRLYSYGTVVEFGGEKEITVSTQRASTKIVGVISDNPAYLMNSDADGLPVALNGRVLCYVKGPVQKGDFLISSVTEGVAESSSEYVGGAIIGKSLSDKSSENIELIEILVAPA